MNGREFWALREFSNDELEASLDGLLGAGARVEARIVARLAEVETRRLHLLAGYSSLYDYCRKRLKLSDYEAFARIAAARVARKYPVVFEMLERRGIHGDQRRVDDRPGIHQCARQGIAARLDHAGKGIADRADRVFL